MWAWSIVMGFHVWLWWKYDWRVVMFARTNMFVFIDLGWESGAERESCIVAFGVATCSIGMGKSLL